MRLLVRKGQWTRVASCHQRNLIQDSRDGGEVAARAIGVIAAD